MLLNDWASEPVFHGGVPSKAIPFWEGVSRTEGCTNVAKYALSCLMLPSSNALIERMFSLVTATKTKPRNRLGVESLDAIIRIKSYMQMRGICCNKLKVSPRMDNVGAPHCQCWLPASPSPCVCNNPST